MAEANLSLRWRVSEIATCPICLEDFHKPKSLPCVHTFCLRCLQGQFKDTDLGDDVLCPVCRANFQIPQKGLDALPNNFFVQNLIEARDLSSKDKVGKIPCEVCQQLHKDDGGKIPPATEFCVDCNQKLCKPCSGPHLIWRGGPHNVKTLGSDMTEDLVQQRSCFCEEHQDEKLKLYCFDCKSNVCLMCKATDHQNHSCKEIRKVAEEFGAMIDADLKPVLQRIVCFQTAGDQMEKESNRFMESIQVVDNMIKTRGKVVEQMVDQIQHLAVELDGMKCGVMKETTTRQDELQFALTAMESFTAYSSELRAKGSPCDITRSANKIHSRAQELLQTYVVPGDYNAPYVSFSAVDLEEFHKAKNGLVGRLQKHAAMPTGTEKMQLQTDRQRQIEQQLETLMQRHHHLQLKAKKLSENEEKMKVQVEQTNEKKRSLEKQLSESKRQAKQAEDRFAVHLNQTKAKLQEEATKAADMKKSLQAQLNQSQMKLQEEATKAADMKKSLQAQLNQSQMKLQEEATKAADMKKSLEGQLNQSQTKLHKETATAADMKRTFEDQLWIPKEELVQSREELGQTTNRKNHVQESSAVVQVTQEKPKGSKLKKIESKEKRLSRLEHQYGHSEIPAIHSLTTDTQVCAVTSANNHLYVLCARDIYQVDAFTLSDYKLVTSLSVPGLRRGIYNHMIAFDGCLYISDVDGRCIHCAELKDGSVRKLAHISGKPYGLSLSRPNNLLITCRAPDKLLEITRKGELVREIYLRELPHPWHALELAESKFLVSHCGNSLERVCVVDSDWKVVQIYGGERGSAIDQLNEPRHLTIDADGFIFVADTLNGRVLLLNPSLRFVRCIASRDHELSGSPTHLHLDHATRRLYTSQSWDKKVTVFQL